ncbi:hypothetical protein PR048_029674 [Dryococelus australis]|uniref:Chitin-binding type-2 domain-containing protein n=1 Tax=Dryococelus australis TaxID=614101 RepID=A0ABQ9GE34_9NEOP|nr:hypothetical protein PR048_029674 [Dryococelus australis]
MLVACALAEDMTMTDEQIDQLSEEQANAITDEQWISIFLPRCRPNPSWKWTSQYFADPRNCNRFYQCVWFKPVRMSCPAGLHFNRRLNVCDYPARAGCRWWRPPSSSE